MVKQKSVYKQAFSRHKNARATSCHFLKAEDRGPDRPLLEKGGNFAIGI